MQIADIALPTFPDEQALFGDETAQACAERLIGLGVKEIVVKDGTEPALIIADGKQTLVPSVKANPVDTTGAGDSFNGGYLAARLKGLSPVEAAQKRMPLLPAWSKFAARWLRWKPHAPPILKA